MLLLFIAYLHLFPLSGPSEGTLSVELSGADIDNTEYYKPSLTVMTQKYNKGCYPVTLEKVKLNRKKRTGSLVFDSGKPVLLAIYYHDYPPTGGTRDLLHKLVLVPEDGKGYVLKVHVDEGQLIGQIYDSGDPSGQPVKVYGEDYMPCE